VRVPRGEARARLIEAARSLVRRKGYAATSVDELCTAAGVTKGAFFHHFLSKEALGVALIDDWTETTGAMFAAHPYNSLPDPLDRVFAYIDLRRELLGQPIVEFSCVAGTTVQEAFETAPLIRAAAARSITSGLDHVRRIWRRRWRRIRLRGSRRTAWRGFFRWRCRGGSSWPRPKLLRPRAGGL
jgi:TetR/AcrR family transcriptional regulator, transcriptional repressor for nem operon